MTRTRGAGLQILTQSPRLLQEENPITTTITSTVVDVFAKFKVTGVPCLSDQHDSRQINHVGRRK